MDRLAIKELAGQLYDKLYAERTQKYRDALAYILYQSGDYTTAESVRLALIAQRARDTLKKGDERDE
jgi:hypothetical protein